MALRHAILASLKHGEASGYDLAKSFDVTVANFWSATPQQLYRELEKMHAAGLVSARVVEQQRRPNKRIYTLTDKGRAEIQAFIAADPRPTAIRDELLVQVETMEAADVPRIRETVSGRRERSEAKLAQYLQRRDAMLAGRSREEFLRTTNHLGPFLTLDRGIRFEQENLAWCERVLADLNAKFG